MKEATVEALRAVNRRFYRERASEFSRSRERPWSGWREIFDRAGTLLPRHPRILDVGCGNGRFARFLEERLGGDFDYCGIDESPLGLAEARKRLSSRENVVLVEHDFLESELPRGLPGREFDLVAIFGVLHHVPSREHRLSLLQRFSALVGPRGLLTFSLWRFDRYPRFRKKIIPWDEFQAGTGIDIDLEDLEPGDCILTWGGDSSAFRFCHAMSEEEEDDIARSLHLDLVSRFDGESEPNRYYLFRYPQAA